MIRLAANELILIFINAIYRLLCNLSPNLTNLLLFVHSNPSYIPKNTFEIVTNSSLTYPIIPSIELISLNWRNKRINAVLMFTNSRRYIRTYRYTQEAVRWRRDVVPPAYHPAIRRKCLQGNCESPWKELTNDFVAVAAAAAVADNLLCFAFLRGHFHGHGGARYGSEDVEEPSGTLISSVRWCV